MKHGWTQNQYALVRIIMGAYLAVHFAQLLPWAGELFSNEGLLPNGDASPILRLFPNVLALWDGPSAVTALISAGLLLTAPFMLGKGDRMAALGLWYVWACLFGRNPLIMNPSLPYVGWILLAHAVLGPPKKQKEDEKGWDLFGLAWILMAVGYSYSGVYKLFSPSWIDGSALAEVLNNPLARNGFHVQFLLDLSPVLLQIATWAALALEILFAPLALSRRTRPWIWSAMLAMHLGLILLVDFADLSFGMVLLHLFTFNPQWIAPRKSRQERLFFDGQCGVCNGFVGFAAAESSTGQGFQMAPLGGEAFQTRFNREEASKLPDSMVYVDHSGEAHVKSRALAQALIRLGGVWGLLGRGLLLTPRTPADAAYHLFSKLRYKLKPGNTCPLPSPELRSRLIP